MEQIIKKADVLIEALPYIKKFNKQIFVIKYGGSTIGDEHIKTGILNDLVFLSFVGIKPVLVHGGGPNITQKLKESGIKTEFVDGLRVTDSDTMKIVDEVLASINEELSKQIRQLGAKPLGLLGKDDIIVAKKKVIKGKDAGFVGEVESINEKPIKDALLKGCIPIISPVGKAADKKIYNINADDVACEIAGSLLAEKLVLLTDVRGIMRHSDDPQSLLGTLNIKDIEDLIQRKVISEGMIPKVRAAASALNKGVKKVHIIDGKLPHALLLEIFTDKGIGTEIVA